MTIYEHRTQLTISAGSTVTTTLRVNGGLCRQVLIRAGSDTTVFRANLVDSNSITRLNWGFQQGEINENSLAFPMVGRYTLNITNASYDDTVQVVVGVEE